MLVGWGSSIDDHCRVTSPGVLSDVRDGASNVEISDAKNTWQTRASLNPGVCSPDSSSTGSGYTVNHGGVVSFVGSVTWRIPTSDGGSHIDRYQVKVTGTSVKRATPIRFCRLSGLSRNQTYTLVLKAHNAAGWSCSKTIRNVQG